MQITLHYMRYIINARTMEESLEHDHFRASPSEYCDIRAYQTYNHTLRNSISLSLSLFLVHYFPRGQVRLWKSRGVRGSSFAGSSGTCHPGDRNDNNNRVLRDRVRYNEKRSRSSTGIDEPPVAAFLARPF